MKNYLLIAAISLGSAYTASAQLTADTGSGYNENFAATFSSLDEGSSKSVSVSNESFNSGAPAWSLTGNQLSFSYLASSASMLASASGGSAGGTYAANQVNPLNEISIYGTDHTGKPSSFTLSGITISDYNGNVIYSDAGSYTANKSTDFSLNLGDSSGLLAKGFTFTASLDLPNTHEGSYNGSQSFVKIGAGYNAAFAATAPGAPAPPLTACLAFAGVLVLQALRRRTA